MKIKSEEQKIIIHTHVSILEGLSKLGLEKGAIGNRAAQAYHQEIVTQLKPNQKIQYVKLEEGPHLAHLKNIGLIKETKKGGAYTFVVPKDAVFVTN